MFDILTYNIHKGFAHFFKHFQLHKIRETLINKNPEIVFLQEICGKNTQREKSIRHWPIEPHLKYLAGSHWPHYIYAKNAIYKSGHHGNGIMSQYPILEWENINIAHSALASRSLLHAKLKIQNISVHIICVHLGLFEVERERQFRILSHRIQSHVPNHEALIIAGDFNDWRKKAERHLAIELNLKEAFLEAYGKHPKTYPALYPRLAVDRIYYRNLILIDCFCLNQKPWNILSDHLPLYAKFKISPDP